VKPGHGLSDGIGKIEHGRDHGYFEIQEMIQDGCTDASF
jgi:hypothetical protein